MIGPILYHEMQVSSRRGRFAVFRWIYAGWLLLQLLLMAFSYWMSHLFLRVKPAEAWAEFGTAYFELFVKQHFILLLLATPVLAASAVTDEKISGTLQYLLTASASPAEIIVGKLLARMVRVLLLMLPGLPLVSLIGVYGGMEADVLLVLLLSTVAVAAGVAAASLLASVWCRQTRDAVAAIGALLAVLGMASAFLPGISQGLSLFSPLPALELDREVGRGPAFLKTCLAWLILGTACVGVAAWRLRPAYCRQLEARRKRARWWTGRRAPVDDQPVRWREREVDGIAPLAVLRSFPRRLGLVLVGLATFFFSGRILLDALPLDVTAETLWNMLLQGDGAGLVRVVFTLTPSGDRFFTQGFAVMLIATLVVGVRCAGTVSHEREQQTWDALLVTALETRALVRGKLHGVLGAFLPYLIVHTLIVLPLALVGGLHAFGWTVMWLAVIAVAGAFAGAVGIWCSARSRSSWGSLLATLGICYVGGSIVTLAASCLVSFVAVFFLMFLTLFRNGAFLGGRFFENLLAVSICLFLAGIACLLAWRLLIAAEKHVDYRERVWQRPRWLPRRR